LRRIAAERAGAHLNRCLFVDDRQENIDDVVGLGMTGVLYREVADVRAALAPVLGSRRELMNEESPA
jgi:putative hydrolase of the HAD superfamily